MKGSLLCLFFVFGVISLKCQNWDPFPKESVYYKIKESNTGSTLDNNLLLPLVKIDTTKIFREVNIPMLCDFTYETDYLSDYSAYMYLDYPVYYELVNDLFYQSNLVIQGDKYFGHWIKTYNVDNEEVKIVTNRDNAFKFDLTGELDTFFFQGTYDIVYDTLGYVSKLDTTYTIGSDSIKHFKIYSVSTNTEILHSDFVFSKLDGLIQMPIPSFFPYCVSLELVGETSSINPYSNHARYLAYKHYPGDEIQRYYKVDAQWGESKKSITYYREVYINQTYDSISNRFTSYKDIWVCKFDQYGSFFNNTLDTVYFLSNEKKVDKRCFTDFKIHYGFDYFLTPELDFLHLEFANHWEFTQENPLYSRYRRKYPHRNYGDEIKIFSPSQDTYIHKVTYTKINGVEWGTPELPGFFMNTEQFNQNVEYINTENGIKLTHPDKYKSGRIYGLDGKFISYLDSEDLKGYLKKDPSENEIQLIILIGKKNENKSAIKF